jgi:hypothetical protein
LYDSPQPPSARWWESRNSHAFFTRADVPYVSPTSASDSSANWDAYVKQMPQEPTQPPCGCCAAWMYATAARMVRSISAARYVGLCVRNTLSAVIADVVHSGYGNSVMMSPNTSAGLSASSQRGPRMSSYEAYAPDAFCIESSTSTASHIRRSLTNLGV